MGVCVCKVLNGRVCIPLAAGDSSAHGICILNIGFIIEEPECAGMYLNTERN